MVEVRLLLLELLFGGQPNPLSKVGVAENKGLLPPQVHRKEDGGLVKGVGPFPEGFEAGCKPVDQVYEGFLGFGAVLYEGFLGGVVWCFYPIRHTTYGFFEASVVMLTGSIKEKR